MYSSYKQQIDRIDLSELYEPSSRARRGRPCPNCGHTDNCSFTEDLIYCRRVDRFPSIPFKYRKFCIAKDGGVILISLDHPTERAWQELKERKAEAKRARSNPKPVLNFTPQSKTPQQENTDHEAVEKVEADNQQVLSTVEQAEPQFIDKVYTALLNNLNLSGNHLGLLTDPKGKRQLTQEAIESLGIKSLPETKAQAHTVLLKMAAEFGTDLLKVPGFYLNNAGELATAFFSMKAMLTPAKRDGLITALEIRPDKPKKDGPKTYWGSSSKYNGPKAAPKAGLYLPVNTEANFDTVIITEGILKAAITANKLKKPVISVQGVGNWQSQEVLPLVLEVAHKGSKVIVAYDVEENKTTDLHRFALADALYEVGLDVYLATWNGKYKGIDDLLLTGGNYTISQYFPGLKGIPVDKVISKDEMLQANGRYYLPDIALEKKITLVKAPKGVGKSEMVSRKTASRNDLTILDVSHRVALTGEHARRFGLVNYQDFKINGVDQEGLTLAPRLTTCIDSLVHFKKVIDRDLIIFDEVDQGLKHLVNKTKNMTKNRQIIVATYKELIKRSGHIIAMSADINEMVYNFFARIVGAENIAVVVCDYVRADAPIVYKFNEDTELEAHLIQAIKEGSKCFVACSSATRARDLETNLNKQFKGSKKILCITQENSAKPEIREMISNLNKVVTAYDVLVSSPTLGTGVDISVDHFDKTYLFGYSVAFNGGGVTASDLAQHMARNRKAKAIYTWVKEGRKQKANTDPQYWIRHYRQKAEDIGLHIEFNDLGERVEASHEKDYLWLKAHIEAETNKSLNNLRTEFYKIVEQEGHEVKPLKSLEEMGITECDVSKITPARQLTKQEREEARIVGILEAPIISDEEAAKLESKKETSWITQEDTYKLEKHRMMSFYGKSEIDREFIELDAKGNFMKKLQNLMDFQALTDPSEKVLNQIKEVRENKEGKGGRSIYDIKDYKSANELRQDILQAMQISLETEFTKEYLRAVGFTSFVEERKEEIFRKLEMQVRSDFQQNPVEFVAKFFSQMGLKLKTCQQKRIENGQEIRSRIAKIDLERFNFMLDLAQSRLVQLEKMQGNKGQPVMKFEKPAKIEIRDIFKSLAEAGDFEGTYSSKPVELAAVN